MRILSLPTPEVLEQLSQYKIVECGAGKGIWLSILQRASIDAIGYDPVGEGIVTKGNHLDLVGHSDRLLLVVWPPDGTDLQEWISIWRGKHIAVCGSFGRFNCPDFDASYETELPPGYKGSSQFKLGSV